MNKVLALALCVALIGCGKKDGDKSESTNTTSSGGAVKASCDVISVAGTCSEYTKEDPLGLTKGLCEGFKGTYGNKPCPTDNLVGTCTMKDDEAKKYYVTKDEFASFSVDDAKKDCESDLLKGKFTASANPPKKPVGSASGAASASGAPAAAGSAPAAGSAKPGTGTPAPKSTGLPGAPPKKH
jgi:hypothetical protein